MVDFQGKVGPAIRCRVPTAKDNKTPPRREAQEEQHERAAPPRRMAPAHDDMNDDIPF
jgi:hypothetical protein